MYHPDSVVITFQGMSIASGKDLAEGQLGREVDAL